MRVRCNTIQKAKYTSNEEKCLWKLNPLRYNTAVQKKFAKGIKPFPFYPVYAIIQLKSIL
jgi:hypothetical protein